MPCRTLHTCRVSLLYESLHVESSDVYIQMFYHIRHNDEICSPRTQHCPIFARRVTLLEILQSQTWMVIALSGDIINWVLCLVFWGQTTCQELEQQKQANILYTTTLHQGELHPTRWSYIPPGGTTSDQVELHPTRWHYITPGDTTSHQMELHPTRWSYIMPGGATSHQVELHHTRWHILNLVF